MAATEALVRAPSAELERVLAAQLVAAEAPERDAAARALERLGADPGVLRARPEGAVPGVTGP